MAKVPIIIVDHDGAALIDENGAKLISGYIEFIGVKKVPIISIRKKSAKMFFKHKNKAKLSIRVHK